MPVTPEPPACFRSLFHATHLPEQAVAPQVTGAGGAAPLPGQAGRAGGRADVPVTVGCLAGAWSSLHTAPLPGQAVAPQVTGAGGLPLTSGSYTNTDLQSVRQNVRTFVMQGATVNAHRQTCRGRSLRFGISSPGGAFVPAARAFARSAPAAWYE